MPFKIEATPQFLTESKKLAKKYLSLKNDIAALAAELAANPILGTSLGNNIYKIRMSITSKGKGKSGGARIITCVKIIAGIVFLVSIYDKSQHENISDKEIKERIKEI